MIKHTGKLQLLTAVILMVASSLAACTQPALPTPTPTAPPPTLPPVTTPTPAPTLTPTQTATPTWTPTPTYLLITPVLQGTPLPESGVAISPANADRLTMLARWGLGNPNDILYTPDGQYLVVACTTGVYFYDPLDYSLLRQIDTPYIAQHLAVSPDSQLLAIADPAQVYIYQMGDFQLLNTFPTQANSLDFSPDGQVLAIGISSEDTDKLQLTKVPSGEILQVFESDMRIWAVRFAPQGGFIASGGYSTKVWSLDGTLTTEQGPYVSGGVTTSLSFSPDGSLLAEGAAYEIRIWRLLENGRLINVRQINLAYIRTGLIQEVVISPDGSKVAAALGMGVSIWDIETGYRIFKAETSDFSSHTSLAWSADSRHLATASLNHGVQVWDVRSQTKLAALQTHTGSYLALDWSADGQILAAGADEGWAHLFDASDGDLLRQIGSGISVNSLSLAPDGQLIALGSEGQDIELWTLDGSLFQSMPGIGFGASEVRFSANGEFFSANHAEEVGRDRTSVWNTRDWSLASTFFAGPNLDYVVTGFDLAPDLQTAAISIVKMSSHSYQDWLHIVTFPDGELVTSLAPVRRQARAYIQAAAYSPSGEMFAMFNSEAYQSTSYVQVWRTSNWQQLITFYVVPEQARSGWATVLQDSIAWSPDSSLLVVGVRDGGIQVFDAANGELLVTLPGHRMWATALAFSPDGRTLASCSLDGTIMLWGIR